MSSNSNGDLPSDSQGKSSDIDGTVRPPIPQFRDTLIGDFPSGYFRNRKRPAQEEDANANGSPKRRHFAEPNLIFRGSFESARDEGRNAGKWLMVNLQDSKKNCAAQNRNVWRHDKVKNLVSQNFILWQVYQNHAFGKWYAQFYHPIKFPYVAIVDPRTGEKLQEWHQVDSEDICERINQFLSEFESLWDRNSDTTDSSEDDLLDKEVGETSNEGVKE